MTLIEVLISLLLVSVGIFAVLGLQSSAWRLAGQADSLGRAAGILQKQLQAAEARLMNPAIPPISGKEIRDPVYASGQKEMQPGDASFRVETTTTDLGKGVFRVNIKVIPAGRAAGISESLIVTRQECFRQ